MRHPAFLEEKRYGGFMQLGLIGLGKMGGNMAERLRLGGHQVVGFDFNAESGGAADCLRAMWAFQLWRIWQKSWNGPEGDLDHGAAGQACGRDDCQA
jgi:hypothetical protein